MEEINNIDCFWFSCEEDNNPCQLEKNKSKPCYLHIPCYYYVPDDDIVDYIRDLIKENERLKLIRVELP